MAPTTQSTQASTSTSDTVPKNEPIDPLQMDIDDEGLDFEQDGLNVEVSESKFCPIFLFEARYQNSLLAVTSKQAKTKRPSKEVWM